MQENIQLLLAMSDDNFQKIIQNDFVLNELQKEKYNPQDQYFQLMMILSKIFKIGTVTVSCITPALWAFLFNIENAYTRKDKVITKTDTDVFLYLLSKGLKDGIADDFITSSAGYVAKCKLDYTQTEKDINNLIYLSFRPLEMLSGCTVNSDQELRYNADWLTHIISIVCPLTHKTAQQVIYDTSLTQCYYYYIQELRQNDTKGIIRRRNSDQINEAIYKRTYELGKIYYQTEYKGKKQ